MFETSPQANSFDPINDLFNVNTGISGLGILDKSQSTISTNEHPQSLGLDFNEIQQGINSYTTISISELSNSNFVINPTSVASLKAVNNAGVDPLTGSALSQENNSIAAQAFAAALLPDLIVQNTVSAPTSAAAGSTIQVSYQIENQGYASADYSYTKFYLSKDLYIGSDDTFLGYDYVTSIPSGYYSPESTTLTIDQSVGAGSYYLVYEADGYDYVAESNENNNAVAGLITITKPDLTISSISATSGTAGNYLNFSYNIKNQGNASAGYSYTAFYLSKDTILDSSDTYLTYDYVNSLSAGTTSLESASVYLDSSLSSGTYYLFAEADGWDDVAESNENNNLVYKTITITKPDLVISSISATSGIAGNYLNFSYNIKNQGTGGAGYSYSAFYLSKDTTLDSSDTYLTYDYVNSLSAGTTSLESASVYLDASLSAGTYYLFVQADGWNYVAESNENNNLAYKAITVNKPDLVISSISATSGTAGSYLNFSYNIKNQGTGSAGYSYSAFYLSKDNKLDSSDTYLDYDYVSSLTAGTTSTESASVYLDSSLSAGTYYLFAEADGWDYVAENNENNNLAYKAITIGSPKQDLVITSISATSGTAGSYLNFSYNIKNQGTASAGYSYTAFYLSTDAKLDSSDIYLDYDHVSSLSAGVSSNRSASVYLDSSLKSGTYYLFAAADDWDDVAESNENNNIAYKAITIGGAAKPDLVISSISATSGTSGSNLNFTYKIKNQGTATANSNSTQFYLSKDTALDSSDTYLGSDSVSSLAAGVSSSESASVALASTLASGTYYLIAKADGGSTISESNENNNLAYQAITITAPAKPDLIISSITASSGVAGTNLSFTYKIKNQGTVSASGSSTGFYLSKNTTFDSSDIYLGLDTVSSLAAGVTNTESASVALSSTLISGTYYLFAKADGENKISESNENNNLAYQTITIKGSDGGADWYSDNLQDAGLIDLTRTLAGDGNLSRNDMISLFRNAKDGAVIDAKELTDLRTIVSNATRFTMQDHVRVLSNYVVNGNPANQWWTGGATTRTALGNLFAGSSDTQLEKLIGKWFLGSDRPNPLSQGDIARGDEGINAGDKTYRAVSGSLFQNGISADDINQGAAGTCYYLATLSSIALEKPSYIQNMFIDNGDNTYTVRFFNNGVANYVTVDKYLPTDSFGQLVYASSGQSYNDSTNELWVALAEKAYAQLAESGWSRPDNVSNGYGSIDGGWMDYVIEQVTGLSATFQEIANMNKTQLINLVNTNQILTAGFVYGAGYGVVNSHAYTITAYNATTGKFHLRNPWGNTDADVTWEQLLSLKAIIIWSNT
ncbi:C2 family cysteine protease [Desmonostoc muscorum LEGE 12446]|uniref:Calpain catalytic domain-containing protein n=1 Tax=Desmonostoc muscorum LEGE 12446 TaxID=1828758 RepID=A0A8J7CZP9_DESMC|nr:CARDB domain-containing protein [Desmonostoc muscorum]MCF2149337.1 C2 family cysteine protease [Desmonostoc muscorum LEGE 12446]